MQNAVERVIGVVPPNTTLVLTKEESAAVLEIAFLAIAADHNLREEELEAFRGVAGRLRDLCTQGEAPHEVGDRELERILESFSGDMDRTVADERLRVVSGLIKRQEIRELAYKVAYALALCDLATSDEEFEFDLQLVDALGLNHGDVDRLEDEVLAAFQA